MDEIKVHYQGFSPSQFTQDYFKEQFDRLLEEAPSSSVLRATISRVDSDFKGVVRISSPAGEFFAVTRDKHLAEIGPKLTAQMRRKLEKWKNQRFSRESTRRGFSFRKASGSGEDISGVSGA